MHMQTQAAILPMMGKKNVVYLYRDEFITDDPAPIASPRTCEPGPGTSIAVQTDGQMSINSSELVFPVQASPTWGDQGFYSSDDYVRAAGLCAKFKLRLLSGVSNGHVFGWSSGNGASFANAIHCVNRTPGGTSYFAGVTNAFVMSPMLITQDYDVYLVLRSSGAFLIIDGRLLYVSNTNNATPLKIYQANYDANGLFYRIVASQLASVWVNTYGPGSAIAGVIVAPQAFAHEPNFSGYFTVTDRGVATVTDYRFRQQDATNYWQLLVGTDGSGILNEVIAGVPTSRGSFAPGTITNGERVWIGADGTTIRVGGETTGANIPNITYAAAINFQTETSGQMAAIATGGTITTLETYPVDLSGAALAALQAM